MHSDFLIIGGGIIGLAAAYKLKNKIPGASIIIIEKEADVGQHASGRNSGVLHAGFYYSADSLKARFCRDGNRMMHAYCDEHGIRVNRCRKLVVACDAEEVEGLRELKRRGDANGVPVELISAQEAEAIEPHVRTHEVALLSPTTSTVNPREICAHLRDKLIAMGVQIHTRCTYQKRISGNRILAGDETYEAKTLINCAGLYAVDIARDFGFAPDYAILPFKGVYLDYTYNDRPLSTLIYGVPDMRKPFLGVQFAIGAEGNIRIGPTAIPAFWRENYRGLSRFRLNEAMEILYWQSVLFITNSFHFRDFALEEMKKYSKRHLLRHAFRMVKDMQDIARPERWAWGRTGIRAQLLNKKTLQLVQDFVVESDAHSLHVLNAVSPAFTSSFAFAEWLVERWRQ